MKVPDFVRAMSVEMGVREYRAGWALRAFAVTLRRALDAGESVTIHGLGTFSVRRCGARVIEDFQNRTHVTKGRKVSFHPSRALKAVI